MTTRSATKTEESSSEPRSVASSARAGSTAARPAQLVGAHMAVFDMLRAEKEPLTARQIERRMKLLQAEVAEILEELCQVRLVRRLNTVIESYTGPTPAFS